MKLKKILSGILATTAVFGGMCTLTACETSHPQVEITLSFEGETYVLDYTLYRKVAPATVAHFLALAEEGYYDGLCVHDYADSRMYTGGYEYTEASELEYKKYYEYVTEYKNFPTTVYKEDGVTPTYTLYGEFDDNDFEVQNGKKNETFGSLTMYYTNKGNIEDRVKVKHPEAGEATRKYIYNSATSLFYISLGGSGSASKYCTFGILEDEDVEKLEDLKTAVDEYVEEDNGLTNVTVDVDEDDAYVGDDNNRETYAVLSSPITIVTVKVKRT